MASSEDVDERQFSLEVSDLAGARAPAETIVAHLRACAATEDPIRRVFHMVGALDEIARAAGMPAAPPDIVAEANELLFAAVPCVVEAVAAAFPSDRIYIGLGSAAALLTATEDNFRFDRALYLGWLLADLRAFLCRSEIRRRGDPLGRFIKARQAWDASTNLNILLQ